MTTKTQTQLKKVTGQNDFPFVAGGMAVADEVSGYVLNEDAVQALVDASLTAETATARVTELEGQLTTAQTAQQTAEAALTTANATINANATRIQELEARVAELEEEPGGQQSRKGEDGGGKGKKLSFNDPNSSINAVADKFFASSRKKIEDETEE